MPPRMIRTGRQSVDNNRLRVLQIFRQGGSSSNHLAKDDVIENSHRDFSQVIAFPFFSKLFFFYLKPHFSYKVCFINYFY
jgi:hypothetical protein